MGIVNDFAPFCITCTSGRAFIDPRRRYRLDIGALASHRYGETGTHLKLPGWHLAEQVICRVTSETVSQNFVIVLFRFRFKTSFLKIKTNTLNWLSGRLKTGTQVSSTPSRLRYALVASDKRSAVSWLLRKISLSFGPYNTSLDNDHKPLFRMVLITSKSDRAIRVDSNLYPPLHVPIKLRCNAKFPYCSQQAWLLFFIPLERCFRCLHSVCYNDNHFTEIIFLPNCSHSRVIRDWFVDCDKVSFCGETRQLSGQFDDRTVWPQIVNNLGILQIENDELRYL